MGTQQILLIVLGVIIVGITVTIALTVFGTGAEQANKDALTQDCLKLVSSAQAFFKKPRLLGGGSNSFDGISIRDCGMEINAEGVGVNLVGSYAITTAAGVQLAVQGVSANNPAQTVLVSVDMGVADPEQRLSIAYSGW